ncbi:hypothetical protein F4777DRAFT_579677 [Nemania sp. FL0916]|nr:hypothetical protein F4777DRAFT_579677 [Nemania sp. FL0916]
MSQAPMFSQGASARPVSQQPQNYASRYLGHGLPPYEAEAHPNTSTWNAVQEFADNEDGYASEDSGYDGGVYIGHNEENISGPTQRQNPGVYMGVPPETEDWHKTAAQYASRARDLYHDNTRPVRQTSPEWMDPDSPRGYEPHSLSPICESTEPEEETPGKKDQESKLGSLDPFAGFSAFCKGSERKNDPEDVVVDSAETAEVKEVRRRGSPWGRLASKLKGIQGRGARLRTPHPRNSHAGSSFVTASQQFHDSLAIALCLGAFHRGSHNMAH